MRLPTYILIPSCLVFIALLYMMSGDLYVKKVGSYDVNVNELPKIVEKMAKEQLKTFLEEMKKSSDLINEEKEMENDLVQLVEFDQVKDSIANLQQNMIDMVKLVNINKLKSQKDKGSVKRLNVEETLQKLPDIYNLDFKDMEAKPLEEYIDSILSKVKRRTGQELLPTCKERLNNFVYLKNHKCASDTMSAVFRRYGYSKNLTLVQPVGGRWNIGWPYWLEDYMHRPGRTGRFNILTEHTVYNKTYMDKIMEPGTVYLTSIREPFGHLKSAFYFFGMASLQKYMTNVTSKDALLNFLNDKDTWDDLYKYPTKKFAKPCVPPNLSVAKNMMSFDLGLPVGHHHGYGNEEHNVPYIQNWLEHLDRTYDMVMLVEYFHESLVMLKRMMCWTAKDVIYLKLNAGMRVKKVTATYPPDLIDSYLRWTLPDTLLYAHFNRTFWERIHVMGKEDFMEEVNDLNIIIDTTIPYCTDMLSTNSSVPLYFNMTKWNPSFNITRDDCNLILSKLGAREELRNRYDADPLNLPQPTPPRHSHIPGC